MDVWPFLMAASDYSDYRVVLCPDFIARAERKDLFRKHIDPTPSDGAETLRQADIDDDKLGHMSLYYSVIRLKRDWADAYDPSGRPLLRIEGLVARSGDGSSRLASGEAARLISENKAEIDGAFEAFWSGKDRIRVAVSKARSTASEPPRQPEPANDAGRRPSRAGRTRNKRPSALGLILIAALAASVSVNAIYIWKGFWRERDRSRIEAELNHAKADLATANDEIARLKKTDPEKANGDNVAK
jgi:hypothetical protein